MMYQMTARLALFGTLAAAATGLFHLPQAIGAQQRETPRAVATESIPRPLPSPSVANLQSLSEAFAAISDQVKPSVVYIRSGRTQRPDSGRGPEMVIPPGFEHFFPDMPRRRPGFEQSSGSGFIVSRDGYI